MSPNQEKLQLLQGFLRFHSETGTEGGYWAFQDSRFISTNSTKFGCSKCYAYWDKEAHPDRPPIPGLETLTITKVMPVDDEMLKKFKSQEFEFPPDCEEGQHDFQLIAPELESYEGLHILQDGDWLTIHLKENPKGILWSGIIKLKVCPPFTQAAGEMWIHSEQDNIDRELWARWFMEGYPATLVPFVKIDFNASS